MPPLSKFARHCLILMIIKGSLVYLQHFRSDPIGFTTEIAKYRKFYGKYSKTCKDSGDLKEESEKYDYSNKISIFISNF